MCSFTDRLAHDPLHIKIQRSTAIQTMTRALDDCLALEAVCNHIVARMGVTPTKLLHQFSVGLDVEASVGQIGVLMDAR